MQVSGWTVPLIRLSLILLAMNLCQGCAMGAAQSGDGFVPLFDGETLDGWCVVGGNATFRVDDGEIVGTGALDGPNTFLRTVRDDFRDFEFRGQFKWDTPGNSGIQFRSRHKGDSSGQREGPVFGYQYEIDSSERAWTGGLHEESRRGWLVPLRGDSNTHKREAVDLSGWNDVVIRCEGRRIQAWLNGVATVDYIDESDRALPTGFFGLQIHWTHQGQAPSQLRWRDLRIKELNADQ